MDPVGAGDGVLGAAARAADAEVVLVRLDGDQAGGVLETLPVAGLGS
jgi:hypothetical protein